MKIFAQKDKISLVQRTSAQGEVVYSHALFPIDLFLKYPTKKKQIDEARLTIDRFVCFKQLKLLIIILMTHTPQVRRNYKKQEFKIRNNFFYLFSHIE